MGRKSPEQSVASDVLSLRIVMANVCFIGMPGAGDREWVLVDTGLPYSAWRILQVAKKRFGSSSRPKAIILTHGHFDHVGAVQKLAKRWDVPVYAHELELPYLTGQADYLPPDPTVGGGLMSFISPLYPRRGIDLGKYAKPLPADGTLPPLSKWRWIHTPGHTPGHISLFRDTDRVLIAGDAFITVKQESLAAVVTQRQDIHGPPMYFTTDWEASRDSVKRLAALRPAIAATGHGLPMSGEPLSRHLEQLVRDFDRLAMPERGRYVHHPSMGLQLRKR
jgi:glyoxylase-like metal-dependent hydrolase (beta-lactamase superfamily II)